MKVSGNDISSDPDSSELWKGKPERCPPNQRSVMWDCNTCYCGKKGGKTRGCTKMACEGDNLESVSIEFPTKSETPTNHPPNQKKMKEPLLFWCTTMKCYWLDGRECPETPFSNNCPF